MSDSFFPISRLIRDRKFLFSLSISMALAAAIGSGAAYIVHMSKINITPIAAVNLLSERNSSQANALPLSSLHDVTGRSSDIYDKTVFEGYITALNNVCETIKFPDDISKNKGIIPLTHVLSYEILAVIGDRYDYSQAYSPQPSRKQS